MTSHPTPAQAASVPAQAAELWKPVLLRAVVALVFAAVTIFWASPSVVVMAWAGALYLAATGLLLAWGARKTAAPGQSKPPAVLAAAAAVMVLCGVVLPFVAGDASFAALAAVAVGAVGAAELFLGFRQRGRHVLARDWITSGVVGAGTAVVLPFFTHLGAHALLGVAGGGAIISGVLWTLAGLSLRHDARPARAEAVN